MSGATWHLIPKPLIFLKKTGGGVAGAPEIVGANDFRRGCSLGGGALKVVGACDPVHTGGLGKRGIRRWPEPMEPLVQPASHAASDAMPRDFAVLLVGIGMAVIVGLIFLASVL